MSREMAAALVVASMAPHQARVSGLARRALNDVAGLPFRHPIVRPDFCLFAARYHSIAGCSCLCADTTSLLSAANPLRLYTAASILRIGILATVTLVMAPSG
jgi:hypothetical protein